MSDLSWRRTNRKDDPTDTLERKLMQAEALAMTLYGEGGEGFRTYNDAVQESIQWLLADLITDAREALDAINLMPKQGRVAK